jgi:hypothetical protein
MRPCASLWPNFPSRIHGGSAGGAGEPSQLPSSLEARFRTGERSPRMRTVRRRPLRSLLRGLRSPSIREPNPLRLAMAYPSHFAVIASIVRSRIRLPWANSVLRASGTVGDDYANACSNAVNLSCSALELRFSRPRMPPAASATARPTAGSTILRAAVNYRNLVDLAVLKPPKVFC